MKKNERNKRVVWASSLLRKYNTVMFSVILPSKYEWRGIYGACHLDLMHLRFIFGCMKQLFFMKASL